MARRAKCAWRLWTTGTPTCYSHRYSRLSFLTPCRGFARAAPTMTSQSQLRGASWEDLYYPEADVEDLEQYRTCGYHPTLIGDSFQSGRYTVVHKLGYGGYSTIWLARDNQRDRYVSLKIKVSETSSRSRELRIMRLLGDHDAEHEGRRFVPNLLDEFSIAGPNGTHSCLVGEPAGSNFSHSKEISTNWKFPVKSARSIAAQLVMGLVYIHNRGVCHGGQCCSRLLRIGGRNQRVVTIGQIFICATSCFACPDLIT